ncbi:GSCFA domain-containing protein [Reyranella sp. MMS21-HV4-11]|uniref:GSCFA domain-containing protein n=1 Tax=Reyranella humidisoli TaxID=2849149 RepID=A0ABS6IPX2_9HYPH|nr:GSCFA domain-containing protein [Reyranella sp. MMS21-HV4-11]MBU8875253.1 GSCFA domain-containing protein [Reyranella sp. MMS21-HV4-11]
MPLFEISAEEILAARSAENDAQAWPTREDKDNRVEPIAKPHFDVTFRLVPGEPIFTIGSCFARNVEAKLLDRGYKIPALDIFKREDFAKIDPSALNNYGVPSIYQELAWALDPEFPFVPEANFSEVFPGKFVDSHLPVGIRPAPLEIVTARREAVRQAVAQVKDCRVIIITLGLTEVWYDKKHDLYINTHPRLKALEAEPERYVLRVLSFDETMTYLRKIADIIDRFGRNDTQIIVTVSPVPMGSTHRSVDVMVANTYSKSVLRTAAEHIVAERRNVHYYPSYESFTLSDRKRAFKYDMVHVEQELVDFNVGRMVAGFAERSTDLDKMDVPTLIAHINEVSENNPRLKWNLLQENHDRISTSFEFAQFYIRTALNRRAFKLARAALLAAPNEWQPAQKELLEAELLIGEEKYAHAKGVLQKLGFGKMEKLTPEGRRCYYMLVEANIGLKDMDAARNAALTFSRQVVKRGGRNRVYEMLAKGYKDAERLKEAAHFYAQAVELSQADVVMLDYAEVLMALKKIDEAKAILEKAACENPVNRRRKEHMLSFVVPRVAAAE